MSYIMNLRKKVGAEPLIMVGACVLIFNNENQLLMQLRKDNKCWGLAGGSMELGESLEDVASREMFEETGLKANQLDLLSTFSGKDFYYQYPHGDEVYNVVTAFICRDYCGSLKFEESEATDIQFFDLTKLPNNISPPDQLVIERFLKL
ncbi:NUDIX hydrolase [Priestia taiwanensis]|uniref:Hydrolase acting on acid anhydrides in phosphorous-containing anhydrides n=1 Tax=Priestia taiwanensis TaxID=1347902 RepID=A0A917ENX9_9BACI|nr:NUDIX hydrolase [Priestia taiwanensis]MBM7362741.1 ADP-ribose pyrophosphatase YjhB (NUDIX family) [Priestia taiwanensis]GGE64692.1 hydrolase acting on acid anhydrides in phosphorous-containing anhydrides [Priestia taiwanensis]